MAKKKKAGRTARSRRGRGEDFTESKATAVEMRTAIDTMELALPEPEDYQHHKKSILGALEKKRTADGFYRNCLKKAQQAGIDTDALLEANRIVRANDPKKTAQQLAQLAFALEQEGFSIQITVHDTLAGDQEDLVARRFYDAGKSGQTFDCRYPENSDLARIAKDNWMKGQAELLGVGGNGDEDGEPALDLKTPDNLPDGQQHATH